MATRKSNATLPLNPQVKPRFNVKQNWTDRLTERPALSPHFTLVLRDRCSQAILDWLIANAPGEIVELQRYQSTMEVYNAEFEASHGFVSEDSNKSILRTVHEAINALDKVGANDFESMG